MQTEEMLNNAQVYATFIVLIAMLSFVVIAAVFVVIWLAELIRRANTRR